MSTVQVSPPRHAEALVREHQAEVWRYLRYLGADRELAADLCQETFVQLLRAPFEDRGPRAAIGWLRTVARNLYLRARRQPQPSTGELEAIEAAWAPFAGEDGGEAALAALRRCLQELDGRARLLVQLHYEERASRAQIGARLGLGGDGVKSLLRRVRALLRGCVQRRQGA